MKKALLITLCLSMAIIAPLRAQFAIGATEWTQLANHFELASSVTQLIKLYTQTVQAYKLAEAQAKHLLSAQTYRGAWKGWIQMSAKDTYGHNIGFAENVNGTIGGFNQSTRPLPDLSGVMPNLSGDTIDRYSWQYAQTELLAATAGYALDTAGEIHQNDQTTNLANMDSVLYTDDDGMNTGVMEAQKTAMAVGILAHQNEDLKRLLAAIVAQQSVEIKGKRDEAEHAMTEQWRWLLRAQAHEMEGNIGDPSARIRDFNYGNPGE